MYSNTFWEEWYQKLWKNIRTHRISCNIIAYWLKLLYIYVLGQALLRRREVWNNTLPSPIRARVQLVQRPVQEMCRGGSGLECNGMPAAMHTGMPGPPHTTGVASINMLSWEQFATNFWFSRKLSVSLQHYWIYLHVLY